MDKYYIYVNRLDFRLGNLHSMVTSLNGLPTILCHKIITISCGLIDTIILLILFLLEYKYGFKLVSGLANSKHYG